ncbi:hypothetical protein Tco_1129741 [Tanacetum coccineum]
MMEDHFGKITGSPFVVVIGSIYYSHLFSAYSGYGCMKFIFCKYDGPPMSCRRTSQVTKMEADVGVGKEADEFSEGTRTCDSTRKR